MKIPMVFIGEVWQEARELCKLIYTITSTGPFRKDYRFRDQMRSSGGSIMDNIAEGFERGGNREFTQFLSIAKGPCGETRSQSYRSYDFRYIDQETLSEMLERTEALGRKIASFMSYLKKSDLQAMMSDL